MAHPALTAPISGVEKNHIFVKAFVPGTPSAFADTMWLGDVIDPSGDFQRAVQTLITSARTIKSTGAKEGTLSFQTVLAPDNAHLATILARFNDGATMALLYVAGAEPAGGAKNYCVYGAFKISGLPNSLSSDVHIFNVTAELEDSSTLVQAFNVTAFPSV